MDMLMAGLLLLAGPDEVVLTGQVRVEGRALVMRFEGVAYDLHGADIRNGDWVQVVGRIERDRVCVHMAGLPFRVRAIVRTP